MADYPLRKGIGNTEASWVFPSPVFGSTNGLAEVRDGVEPVLATHWVGTDAGEAYSAGIPQQPALLREASVFLETGRKPSARSHCSICSAVLAFCRRRPFRTGSGSLGILPLLDIPLVVLFEMHFENLPGHFGKGFVQVVSPKRLWFKRKMASTLIWAGTDSTPSHFKP